MAADLAKTIVQTARHLEEEDPWELRVSPAEEQCFWEGCSGLPRSIRFVVGGAGRVTVLFATGTRLVVPTDNGNNLDRLVNVVVASIQAGDARCEFGIHRHGYRVEVRHRDETLLAKQVAKPEVHDIGLIAPAVREMLALVVGPT